MNKKRILFAILTLTLSTKVNAQAYVGFTIGSAIDGKIVKDGQLYKSGFSPEIDIYGGLFLESFVSPGLLLDMDLRIINIKEISFFEKSYKSVSDFYIGPAILIGDRIGIVISGMIGYSFSSLWGIVEDEVNVGALSFKVSADLILGPCIISVFYRPETQLIKQKSWANQYGEFGYVDGFIVQPSWGVRIGVGVTGLY